MFHIKFPLAKSFYTTIYTKIMIYYDSLVSVDDVVDDSRRLQLFTMFNVLL